LLLATLRKSKNLSKARFSFLSAKLGLQRSESTEKMEIRGSRHLLLADGVVAGAVQGHHLRFAELEQKSRDSQQSYINLHFEGF
jgi:hypothetical protein